MKTKIFFIIFILFCASNIAFAKEEKIEIPDVTTFIEGDAQNLKLPAPDFEIFATKPIEKVVLEPVELEPIEIEEEGSEEKKIIINDTVVQGIVGGGYPPSFLGKFGIENKSEEDPYSIDFVYDSVAAMASNSLTDCFNSINTSIHFYKAMTLQKGNLALKADYASSINGFQSMAQSLGALNQIFVDLNLNYNYYLRFFDCLNITFDGVFYNRYSDITDSTLSIENWQAESRMLCFMPSLSLSKTFLEEALTLKLNANYNLDMDIYGSLVNSQTLYTSGKTLNRTFFDTSLEYKKNKFYFESHVGAVAGSHQNENIVIVPFSLKLLFSVPFENYSDVNVAISGGLKTSKTDISKLEKQYKYSAFSFLPHEESFWFSQMQGNLQLRNNLFVKGDVSFSKSALNNGVWFCDYDKDAQNGLYTYSKKDITSLSTSLSFDFIYNLFNITGKFCVNLFDLLPLQNRYEYYAKIKYNASTNWEAFIETQGALDASDKTPILNAQVSYKLKSQDQNSMQVILFTKDAIKFFSGASREYAGNYICDSGSITLMLEFTL